MNPIAVSQGFNARYFVSADLKDNPYTDQDEPSHSSWSSGWKLANVDLENRNLEVQQINTFRDLLNALSTLNQTQLDCPLTYFDTELEEHIEFQYVLKFNEDATPYFEITFD